MNAIPGNSDDGRAANPVMRFAGLRLDLAACTLTRDTGEAIPLTRGEFGLLRAFVARPGRVLSRDALLDATANRPLEPFDRSIDVLVGRLRRKIEPDPKAPRLIVTVPGEGYRFDGLAQGGGAQSAPDAEPAEPEAQPQDAPPPGLEPETETAASASTAAPAPRPVNGRRRLEAIGVAAALVGLLAGGAYFRSAPPGPAPPEAASQDRLTKAPRLSIVVLPFDNLSGDPEQDYFAEGITDDLTTDLSHLQDSFVIARGTAYSYKGKPIDVRQIGRDLGVRYALEGSVRRVGDAITVNAQLLSTETGAHVWADRFEGERGKLGTFQVEAVARLANALGAELVRTEALRAARKRPDNPVAEDLALQGEVKLRQPETKVTLDDAVVLYDRALALDPQNVRALTGLADALSVRVDFLWSSDPVGDTARADKAIAAALAIQPHNSYAHRVKGISYEVKRQWRKALAEAEMAIADNRNNADAHALQGFWMMFIGRSEDGFEGVETALRMSPLDPEVGWWKYYMCHLHSHLANWDKAVDWCSRAAASLPGNWLPLVDLATADAWAGRDREAREAVAQLQKVYPGFTVQTWATIPWSDDATFTAQYARITEGLRRAGLQEQ